MIDEEAYENHSVGNYSCRSGRCPVRLADPGGYESLYRCDRAATPVSAAAAVPHCLDHSLWTHGIRQRQDLAESAFDAVQPGAESIRSAADLQFLLEPDLFQRPGLRLRFLLAAGPVAAGVADDSGLSRD